MARLRSRLGGPVTAAALLAAASAGCGGEELAGSWRDVPGGGAGLSWEGVPFRAADGLEIGAVNDADDLYLCLYPTEPAVQMVLLRQGATVWLDHAGEKVGVRIARRRREEPPPDGEAPAPGAEARRARALRAPRDLEILRAGGDVLETRDVESRTAALLVESAEHVYFVLRLTLGEGDDPVLVGAGPGASLDLVVETPVFDPLDSRRGGRPPGGGGGRGGERARRGRPDFDPPKPVRLRARLLLASPPGGASDDRD